MLDALLAAHLAPYFRSHEESNPWMADALCREHPDLEWFPRRSEGLDETREVCAACLVRAECYTYATTHDVQGIWAATGARARRNSRARSRAA